MALAGLIDYDGEVLLNKQDINSIKNKELRKKIQIVFQDPYNSLNPRMTIKEIIEEGLRVHFKNMTKAQWLDKIKKTLYEVGLKDDVLDKYPHEFSGGQRQRIAIARALVVEPDLLILDEPTSALDVTIAAQILKLLHKIQCNRKISYLFISHDFRAIRALADDIAVMKYGKIVEINVASKIFEMAKNPYTKKLIYAANIGKSNDKSTYKKHYKNVRKIQRSETKRMVNE